MEVRVVVILETFLLAFGVIVAICIFHQQIRGSLRKHIIFAFLVAIACLPAQDLILFPANVMFLLFAQLVICRVFSIIRR